MTENDLHARVCALPLFGSLVGTTLPALAGGPGSRFDVLLVGVSDVAKASTVLAVLACAATREVAVVWVANSVLRGDDSAELAAHVYPLADVLVSSSAVVHDDGLKADLILVLPDGQSASGTREVRLAVSDAAAVGRAVRTLRAL